jgi:DNA-binding PadR family transcriptional regulator
MGVSENNRKGKFYTMTRKGRKQLAADTDHWERLAEVMRRLLSLSPDRRAE